MRHWRDRLDKALENEAGPDHCDDGTTPTGRTTVPDQAVPDKAVPDERRLDAAPLVDRVSLHHAGALCPAGALAPDPERFDDSGRFIEATFTATREVALVALRSAVATRLEPIGRIETIDPVEMVESTLATPEDLRWGVTAWIEEADRAALATLRNAAVSWVTDARALAARHGNPDWQAPGAMRFDPPGRGVQLTATIDAVRVTGSGKHLFVMRSRSGPTDSRVAGRIALLRALDGGQVATSVVLGFRDSLQRATFQVTEELLDAAVHAAVDDIYWAQRPSLAPRIPGPQCRFCRLLAQCPEGATHVAATRRYPLP